MSYARPTGYLADSKFAGIPEAQTNPSPLGYSISLPLARIRKPTLDGALNIRALDYPASIYNTRQDNTISGLGTFTEEASQFAKDLYTETTNFFTTSTFGSIPNYMLVIGGVLLLTAFHTGKRRR